MNLLTLRQAAERYGIYWNTLRAAVRRGQLPAEKLGSQWTVTEAAVRYWQAHARHVPGPAPGFKRQRREQE